MEYNGRDETQIYYLTERYRNARAHTEAVEHLFVAKSPENEITIDDLRKDEDTAHLQFPSIFQARACTSWICALNMLTDWILK